MSYSASFAASGEPDDFDALAAFDQVEAAKGREPLPEGTYNVRVLNGTYDKTRTGKNAYKMTFEVIDEAHAGKRLYHNWTCTAKSLTYVKRDLKVFGLNNGQALLQAFPPEGEEVLLTVFVVVHAVKGYDTPMNEIKSFKNIVHKPVEARPPGSENSPFRKFALDKPQEEEGK